MNPETREKLVQIAKELELSINIDVASYNFSKPKIHIMKISDEDSKDCETVNGVNLVYSEVKYDPEEGQR